MCLYIHYISYNSSGKPPETSPQSPVSIYNTSILGYSNNMSTTLSDNALDVHPQDALKPLHLGRFFYLRYSSQYITLNNGHKVVILLVLNSLKHQEQEI